MSLRDIQIESEYRNLHGNIIHNFYNPLLSEAIAYDRSVGFFSSTALSCFSVGLCNFLKNGGKIRLVATPYLSTEDIQAMRDGYKVRNEIIENALVRNLFEPANGKEVDRLNMLANLIAECRMDIKIALTKAGMYHEKLGIIEDSDGNFVAFSGSSNESENAFLNNYESTDVFCSWKEFEKDRALKKKKSFEKIWNGADDALEILDFPKLKDEIIRRYKKSAPKFDMDDDVLYEPPKIGGMNLGESTVNYSPLVEKNVPMMPKWFEEKIFDYQKEAIENWAKHNYCGIFDMATGTGKTLTGLGALTKLYNEKKNEKLFAIIVCPYQHLVEQWVDDIEQFNINPIIGFSSSPQKDWKQKLRLAIVDIQVKSLNKFFSCFICTNATFSSAFVQEQISRIKVPKILIVDEAHNFGAPYLSKLLLDSYQYRLGLSATINRHGDEEGTKSLFDFFGDKCIEYDIERAIKEKKLTPYKYHPIPVYFNDEELIRYKQLTKEISNNVFEDGMGHSRLTDYGKILAMQRARIIAGANSKQIALKECITPYKNDTHILVYCGATSGAPQDADKSSIEKSEERQIETISKILGNELNIKNHHFTSNESVAERNEIKERFTKGELQALVAIKCLDEGVNIPKIKTAFILASTTNPKEYIQRRGRVLRLAKGKDFAEIYDFITLPYSLNVVPHLTELQKADVMSLVRRELYRAEEFARIAMNWGEAELVLNEIREAYGFFESVNQIAEKEIFDE